MHGRDLLRLLHTADLHLGSDTSPERSLQGLRAVEGATRRLSVDVLLIAGDLFDTGAVPAETLTLAFNVLGSLPVPVVVLPGNHDTILLPPRLQQNELPANVRLLVKPEGELAVLESLGLSIWGRAVYEHSPTFRPLQGLPKRPPEGWYIAMAHGAFTGAMATGQSSPIIRSELAAADCDYVALGHVHTFRDVSCGGPPAFYCGSPWEPWGKAAALVTLNPHGSVSVESVPL